MFSAALSRLSTNIRPCRDAAPSTTSRANSRSAVTTEPARLPLPRRASSTACAVVSYGSTVLTGPNASTSCGCGWSGSSQRTSSGGRNAPRSGSASTTSTRSGSPCTRVPASSNALSDRRTSSRCSRLASAPIRTSGEEGLPTTTLSSRALAAATTSSMRFAGTSARRIAVHFCPALTVISVTSCLTNRSNSSVPGAASGPRIEQFSESASTLNRTEFAATTGWVRNRWPVEAEPVNDTRSWSVRCSKRSPTPPQISCSEPTGNSPESTISSTSRCVRYAVWLAGLIRLGTPARKAGANFSSGPHTGKLNALICTATPRNGVQMCCPTNVPPLLSGSTAPSAYTVSLGSSRRPLLE